MKQEIKRFWEDKNLDLGFVFFMKLQKTKHNMKMTLQKLDIDSMR